MTPKWKFLVTCLTFVPAGVGRQIAVADITDNRFSFSFHWNGFDRFVGKNPSQKQHVSFVFQMTWSEVEGMIFKQNHRKVPSNDANNPPQLPTCCCQSTARWNWQTSVWQVSWRIHRSRGKPLWGHRSGWLQRSSSSLPTTPRWALRCKANYPRVKMCGNLLNSCFKYLTSVQFFL